MYSLFLFFLSASCLHSAPESTFRVTLHVLDSSSPLACDRSESMLLLNVSGLASSQCVTAIDSVPFAWPSLAAGSPAFLVNVISSDVADVLVYPSDACTGDHPSESFLALRYGHCEIRDLRNGNKVAMRIEWTLQSSNAVLPALFLVLIAVVVCVGLAVYGNGSSIQAVWRKLKARLPCCKGKPERAIQYDFDFDGSDQEAQELVEVQ